MKHYDCTYYLPIDAFKGICKRDKDGIFADEESCGNFQKAAKCKYCMNFSPTGIDLGTCLNRYDTWPEMNSITCNDFKLQ